MKTGESWSLERMLACGVMPWFWLDYSPDAPREIFGDRHEGYLAAITFGGDLHRLRIVRDNAVVTMLKTHDGRFFRVAPGFSVAISELRFERNDIEACAGASEVMPPVNLNTRVKQKAQEIAETMSGESKKMPSMSAVAGRLAVLASEARKSSESDRLFVGQKGARSVSWYKAELKGWQPEKIGRPEKK